MVERELQERHMEELIANFPDDFFPGRNFVLQGRQRSFVGVGRFDLLFQDGHATNILMELKKRPAKYEDATQLAKYKDELVRLGQKRILMWLVAPHIPNSVREFLDHIGIEYTEIHVAHFRQIAERHEVKLTEESSPSEEPTSRTRRTSPPTLADAAPRKSFSAAIPTGASVTFPSTCRWKALGFDLGLQNSDEFDTGSMDKLIDAFEEAVPSRKNAYLVADLRRWASNPRSTWPLGSCRVLLRWVTTSVWKTAVAPAGEIWSHLFGRPAPTWYVWNQGSKKYEFDADGWRQWYESLPH